MGLSPQKRYQNELARYGLGLGAALTSPTKLPFDAPVKGGSVQRKLRGGIGSSGAMRTPFAEEGAGLIVENLSPYKFNGGPMSVEDQKKLNESKKIQGRGPSNKPFDVTSFSEFAEAYAELAETNRPEPSISERPDMVSLMESNPSAFADSPLDAIAAQIEKASLRPLVGAGDQANAQSIIAANQRDAASEEFRADEAELFDDTSLTIAEGDKISEDTFKAAMDGFLGSARGASPDKREKTLAEYKKEFAAATGVDVSGKVDKSQALMAMGLALMQNRAGKGFNVGKLLNAVGQAGEKALPSLEKAKTEAKKAGLAAGQYALQSRNSDQAKDEADVEKGKQRSAFYIVPKGKGVSGFLANIDQGQLENLNPFELDALMSNKSFQEAFDVVPGSTWSGIVEEAMKTKEAGVYWDTKAPRKIELFGEGAGDMFTIEAWRALPQSGKDNKLVGSGQDAYEGLARAARDMGKARDKFSSAFGLIEGTTAFRFTLDKVDSLAAAFGVNFKEGTNKTEKLKLFLTKLQAQNAKEILGEAGKTISDADRALVKTIVGDVDLFQNTELLEQKVTELFQEIIVKKEQNILDALTTLDRYSGRRIASRLNNGELDEAGYAELQGYLASPAFKEN